jgi:hypothetical protein
MILFLVIKGYSIAYFESFLVLQRGLTGATTFLAWRGLFKTIIKLFWPRKEIKRWQFQI